MHKTCAVVTEAVKNKKILDENQQTIHQKNLNIKDTETQIDEESEKLNKLDRFIDQSKQELPLQLKVMQFSYTMGNIIANRWAKRAEFNRCVAET
jgi:Tfp pilus assembly protein PilN